MGSLSGFRVTLEQVFKPRAEGGLGVGPKAPGDGIQFRFVRLGERALTKAQLKKLASAPPVAPSKRAAAASAK